MKIVLKTAILLLWLTITALQAQSRAGSEPTKSTGETPMLKEWWRGGWYHQ
ncbi:MAG TPA: hypothetical protein VEC36_07865 [Patescibacteria group bacterium]|nr:hypothetical protein [Patescibacteria group bacterium]